MKYVSLFDKLLVVLLFAAGPAAQAQAPATLPKASLNELIAIQQRRYTAAHDSLMRLVATVHAQDESRRSHFKASMGSFGGLHRRVRTFDGTPKDNSILSAPGSLSNITKKQVIKHRFGIELEKVTYYDSRGREVLKERYEAQQLICLELLEYPEMRPYLKVPNEPSSKWLFVRGDYLSHIMLIGSKRSSSFFYSRPSAE